MWTFFICDKEIRWRSKPIHQANIPNTALAMYPPQVSPQWKLYAAFGTGNHETCGRWHLIDERGWLGKPIELEDEQYVSVLHRADGAKNRPRALLFTDAADKERGVMFLTEFQNSIWTANKLQLWQWISARATLVWRLTTADNRKP